MPFDDHLSPEAAKRGFAKIAKPASKPSHSHQFKTSVKAGSFNNCINNCRALTLWTILPNAAILKT